jgi:hypothetical protein
MFPKATSWRHYTEVEIKRCRPDGALVHYLFYLLPKFRHAVAFGKLLASDKYLEMPLAEAITSSKQSTPPKNTNGEKQEQKISKSKCKPVVAAKTPFQQKWENALTIEEARESSLQFVRKLWGK